MTSDNTSQSMKTPFAIATLILMIVFGILYLAKRKDESNLQSSPTVDKSEINSALPSNNNTLKQPANTGQYIAVLTLKGNGRKNSASFHLNGNEAKILYQYRSGVAKIGVFNIYLLEKGQDLMKTGGFPEVSVNTEQITDESAIQSTAGDYYLNVNAYGWWQITVMQKQ